MTKPRGAIFLDRDDTLIVNIPYLGDPSKVVLLPGVAEGLQRLHRAGWPLVIVSNQSGVGRGLITKAQVAAVNAEMIRQVKPACFLDILNCYAAPEDPYALEERKPSPYLIQEACRRHHLEASASWMIGDRWSDIEAGRRAGCRTIWLRTGTQDTDEERAQAEKIADFVADHFSAAVNRILNTPAYP